LAHFYVKVKMQAAD